MARRRKRYKVKAGDNYFTIAEELFGDQRFAGYLIRANPGINVLHPGIVLKVPKIDPETTEPIIGQAAWERVMAADEERQVSRVDEELMAIDEMEAFEEGPQAPFSVEELAAEQEMWLNNPKIVKRWAEMFANAAREAGLVPEVVEPVSEVEETADVPSISDMAWEAEQTDDGGLDVAGDNVFGTQASQLEAARQEEEQRDSDVETALLAEQTDDGGLDVAGDNVFGT